MKAIHSRHLFDRDCWFCDWHQERDIALILRDLMLFFDQFDKPIIPQRDVNHGHEGNILDPLITRERGRVPSLCGLSKWDSRWSGVMKKESRLFSANLSEI